MVIQNQADLSSVIENQARKAIEEATEEVLDLFKEKYVQAMVYDSHEPNKDYYNKSKTPTGEFKEAWLWTDIKKSANRLITTFFYNPSLLSHDAPTFLHGSTFGSPTDAREDLAAILNKTGPSSSHWISVIRPQAYFDEFIQDMFDNGDLEKILTKYFVKYGFTPI